MAGLLTQSGLDPVQIELVPWASTEFGRQIAANRSCGTLSATPAAVWNRGRIAQAR
jgi:hypothetical protein